MGLFSFITSLFQDDNEPEIRQKDINVFNGEGFENYVYNVCFPASHYDCLHRTHSFAQNEGRFIEETLQPDFRFRAKYGKIEFYVECKFRENRYNDSVINIFKAQQLYRYKSYKNVFLMVKTKSSGHYFLSFVPMKDIFSDNLSIDFLLRYKVYEGIIYPRLVQRYI